MGRLTVPVIPIHGLDFECPVAPGNEPHFELPAAIRKQLKEEYQANPKVIIGSAWKIMHPDTPKTGVTPIFTARCLNQLGAGPSNLVVDPRLQQGDPIRINWGFVGWVLMALACVGVLTSL